MKKGGMNYTAYSIPNGESKDITGLGSYVRVKASASGLVLQVDSEARMIIGINFEYKLPEGETFKELRFRNDTGAAVTIEVFHGFGEVDVSELGLTGTIDVDDADTHTKLDTLIALLQDDEDQRLGVNVLGANTVGATGVASATLITPAANTAGIWVRNVHMGGNSGDIAYLYAATSAPSGSGDVTKPRIASSVYGNCKFEPIFLPAGTGLYFAASSTGVSATVNYD